MVLSAVDLQKRHDLEGAPDPFPAFNEAPQTPSRAPAAPTVDVESHAAFPSLAPASVTAPAPAQSVWGADSGPRIKSTIKAVPVASKTFNVHSIDLSTAGKDGKPTTLGEIMKQTMQRHKVKIEASSNQKTRQTTFHLKAESQKELEKAERSLLADLSPVVTLTINAPASTIASIIGPKGATLKQIRDQTGVKVDIPRRDTIPISANGHANGHAVALGVEDEEEITVPITLVGAEPFAHEAQAMLQDIINSKTSRTTQRVRDIPAHILPFVTIRRPLFIEAAQGGDVNLALNAVAREITVSGEREAVSRVIEAIRGTVEAFKSTVQSVKMALSKRQHRLLVGKAIDEIMAQGKCFVIVPPFDDPSEEVVVWGKPDHLPDGLSAVMMKANSQYIHEFPLPGPITLSQQLLNFMMRIGYPKTLSDKNPGVNVFVPSASAVAKASVLNIDIVGEKPSVDNAVRELSGLIGKMIGATKELPIDWLVHRIIMGKNAKRIKQWHEVHNVQVFFPPETAEQSSVLLVYDPFSPSASPSPVEKERNLDEVAAELLKMAKDAADVKSETIIVEKRWHDAVVGQGGTTLNAIIGEDKTLSIKLGAEAGVEGNEDVVFIRGTSTDVDRAVQEILQIVEDAKNDEIVNSYSTEFDIDREYVGRIVGAQGAGVKKLRDTLGVKIDVSDEGDDSFKEAGKKKKPTHQKSKIKITGRKENAEEAKKRILAQVERFADETSEVLKIPSQYHSSLIGQGGKYATRLEENYSVKITFPRQSAENGENKTREQLKSDEVLVKGGKKGVAGAKAELLEALEFEKESNNVIKFQVPTRSVARILGKGGASINDIKLDTGAQIDVDRATDESGNSTQITVRGSKAAISAAKAAILAISEQVIEETTAILHIENKFHRTIIGAGGQGLKELILRCGGPSDSKLQAGLVRFPRPGDSSDEVRIRGEPKLVGKVQAELEKIVAVLRDRVVLAVEIPVAQHRNFIGRGGQHLNDFQTRTGVQVQFPGSRSYDQVGEPGNAADLEGVAPANIVKVSGPRAACEAAVAELTSQVKAPAVGNVTATISVPLKYHHAISQQGNFFRTLRSYGVQVDQSAQPQKSAVPSRPPPQADMVPGRIDDSGDTVGPEVLWQVISNYTDAEDGDSTWTLRARDAAALERAQAAIQDAIKQAEEMSHVGFLTLPDRSAFPRIVGSKGANVARLRNETGADITVSRVNNTIVIIGSEDAITAAKEAILKMVSARSQRRD